MSKNMIIVIIVLGICFILGIFYIAYDMIISKDSISKFNNKISKLEDSIINDKDMNFAKEDFTVFISISDSEKKAYVTNSTEKTLKKAIDVAKKQMINNIKKYNINPEWVRLDVLNEKKETLSKDFYEEISKLNANTYRRGIILDSNYDIALLENEINANNIIDYEKKSFNLDNLNKYITSDRKEKEKLKSIPKNFTTFTCVSYIDDSKKIYKLGTSENNFGRRETSNIDELFLIETIENASEYLIDAIKENGEFIYRYNPSTNEEVKDYNILRHEGSVWSMIQAYNLTKNKELKENIDLAIKYVANEAVKYKDNNTAYIIEGKNNEIKLGANGIGILMFIEYMETFKNKDYEDLVLKLANGISDMQNNDGSHYHVYMYPNFKKHEKFRTVYYDGEATYALTKLYNFTKDKKWLRKAEKSLQYFYDNGYEKYKDHWIEYSVNEVTKYNPKKEYIELGLKNITVNLKKIMEQEYWYPVNLELLNTGIEIYDRAVKNNISVKDFDVGKLIEAIYYRANIQIDGLFYPEVSMYFENPKRITNAFYVRNQKFRIRIDDVQHNINGYYKMYNNYKLIKKYSE